jgi:putative membrane protein
MEFFTRASFQPGPAVLVALTTAAYLWAAVRARRSGRGWSGARTGAFCLAEGLYAVAFFSGLPAMHSTSFSAYAAQYIMAVMIAPVLAAFAAPLALLARSAPWGERLLRGVESPAGRLATNPVLLWVLYAASLFGLFFSGLYGQTARNPTLQAAVFAVLAFVAWLYCWPVADVDPRPRRLGYVARSVYLLLAFPLFSVVGMGLQSQTTPIAPGVSLADLHTGAAVIWVAGETLVILGVVGVWLQWLRDDERRARARDLENTAAAERQLALWRATREAAARAATPRR